MNSVHATLNNHSVYIETGKFDPSLPLAFRIASVFQLTIDRIFQPEDASESSTA